MEHRILIIGNVITEAINFLECFKLQHNLDAYKRGGYRQTNTLLNVPYYTFKYAEGHCVRLEAISKADLPYLYDIDGFFVIADGLFGGTPSHLVRVGCWYINRLQCHLETPRPCVLFLKRMDHFYPRQSDLPLDEDMAKDRYNQMATALTAAGAEGPIGFTNLRRITRFPYYTDPPVRGVEWVVPLPSLEANTIPHDILVTREVKRFINLLARDWSDISTDEIDDDSVYEPFSVEALQDLPFPLSASTLVTKKQKRSSKSPRQRGSKTLTALKVHERLVTEPASKLPEVPTSPLKRVKGCSDIKTISELPEVSTSPLKNMANGSPIIKKSLKSPQVPTSQLKNVHWRPLVSVKEVPKTFDFLSSQELEKIADPKRLDGLGTEELYGTEKMPALEKAQPYLSPSYSPPSYAFQQRSLPTKNAPIKNTNFLVSASRMLSAQMCCESIKDVPSLNAFTDVPEDGLASSEKGKLPSFEQLKREIDSKYEPAGATLSGDSRPGASGLSVHSRSRHAATGSSTNKRTLPLSSTEGNSMSFFPDFESVSVYDEDWYEEEEEDACTSLRDRFHLLPSGMGMFERSETNENAISSAEGNLQSSPLLCNPLTPQVKSTNVREEFGPPVVEISQPSDERAEANKILRGLLLSEQEGFGISAWSEIKRSQTQKQ